MDILRAVDAFVGVPYLVHGRSPNTGWDCWGCVAYIRNMVFGKATPSWDEAYTAAQFSDSHAVEALIKRHMEGWVQKEITPGVVLLFKTLGCDAHVGVYLERGQFIHAIQRSETAIVPVDQWKHRLVGAYDTE